MKVQALEMVQVLEMVLVQELEQDTGLGFGSATRTTDSLFGDMLQLETQIGSTQERLRPFSMAPVPTTMQYDVPPVNPIQQFLQQQEAQRLRNKPQGMLTNAEILKRFPY